MPNTFRDDSRREWESKQTVEHINFGSFQRIADALEKLSRNWEYTVNEYARLKVSKLELERKLSAAKGQITKLNKRLAK